MDAGNSSVNKPCACGHLWDEHTPVELYGGLFDERGHCTKCDCEGPHWFEDIANPESLDTFRTYLVSQRKFEAERARTIENPDQWIIHHHAMELLDVIISRFDKARTED